MKTTTGPKVRLARVLLLLCGAYLLLCGMTACVQRKLIYFPTHEDSRMIAESTGLREWECAGRSIGFVRVSPSPAPGRVWLLLHGNAGQAAHRGYLLPCFSEADSVYILEWPGYGGREGKSTRTSWNAAAEEAYREVRRLHPAAKVCVLGESLGSGPSCHLASLPNPPDRLVLAVPFDRLADVASEKVRFLPVSWLLLDRWDNIEALRNYPGPVEIIGERNDQVIPVEHARRLAQSKPGARYRELDGGHGDWQTPRYLNLRD